jgi:hypothetical protein
VERCLQTRHICAGCYIETRILEQAGSNRFDMDFACFTEASAEPGRERVVAPCKLSNWRRAGLQYPGLHLPTSNDGGIGVAVARIPCPTRYTCDLNFDGISVRFWSQLASWMTS